MNTWSLVNARWIPGEVDGSPLRWFDVQGPADPGLDLLAARYGLHDLAIEDCRSLRLHAPKVDDFGDHLFLVFHAFIAGREGLEPRELNVFLGQDFLITYRDEPVPAIQQVVSDIAAGILTRPGTDGLLYAVIDRLVDAILPETDEMAEELDRLQEAILAGAMDGSQEKILALRSRAGHMRRLLTGQESVLVRLSRGEFPQIQEANRIYFRDIYDHLVRINFALEGVREDCEMALSTLLSAVNNRLSEVMKVLSIVGALALPASVIAGIFGTNFDNVPGLHSNIGFFLMLAAMGGVALFMAMYFRRKGWF